MRAVRFILGLAVAVAWMAPVTADESQRREWRGTDNQVLAQGTLLDVQGDVVTVYDATRRQKKELLLKQLSDADRQHVARAMEVAQRFGIEFSSTSWPTHDAQKSTIAGQPAAAAGGSTAGSLVAVRLILAPEVVQSFRVIGKEARRFVVQQQTPDKIVRLVCYDGSTGELLHEFQVPDGSDVLDISPDGELVAVHRVGPRRSRHSVEVYSLTDSERVWSYPEPWFAGAFIRKFYFVDEKTLVEYRFTDRQGTVGRVWDIEAGNPSRSRWFDFLADQARLLIGHWNNLRIAAIDVRICDRIRRWGHQEPSQPWTLPRDQRLETVATESGIIALTVTDGKKRSSDADTEKVLPAGNNNELQSFDLVRGVSTDDLHFSFEGARPDISSTSVDSATGATAFITYSGGHQPHEFVVLNKNGSLRTRHPVQRLLPMLGGHPRCVAVGDGRWALMCVQGGEYDSQWSESTKAHVFDEKRGAVVWTYTIDRAILATRAPGGMVWLIMPDPDSVARTIVVGLQLPDPRAQHFINWAGVVEGQEVPGFRSQVVPGPMMFQPWVVKEDKSFKQGTMFAELRAVE